MPYRKITELQGISGIDAMIVILPIIALYHSYILANFHDQIHFILLAQVVFAFLVAVAVRYFTRCDRKVILLFAVGSAFPLFVHALLLSKADQFPFQRLDLNLTMEVRQDSDIRSWGNKTRVSVRSINHCSVKRDGAESGDACHSMIGKDLILNDYRGSILKAGQIIEADVRLKPVLGFQNPKGFDYSLWAYNQGYYAKGYFRSEIKILSEKFSSVWGVSIRRLLMAEYEEKQRSVGLLLALMLADKSYLDESDKTLLINNGLIHLFVISGLHIGLVFLSLLMIFKAIVLACLTLVAQCVSFVNSHRAMSAWYWFSRSEIFIRCFALLITFLYVLQIQMPMPALRALLFLCIWQVALMFRLQLSLFQVLSITLWIIVCILPSQAFEVGLWMSFLAVLALWLVFINVGDIKVSERLSEIGVQSVQSKPVLSVIRAIWLLLKTQFYVVIMLLPLTQMMGADFTLLTFLWNMMLIPLFSVVVIPSLVLAGLVQWIFLGAADSLSMFLAHAVAQFLVGLLNAISEFGDHWSDWFYDLPLSLELIPQGIILYPFILLFLLPVYRYLRLFGFAMFSVLILVRSEQKSALEVWFLDVGQALSVVMIKDNRALVYDTGFVVGKFNAFDAVIEPFLRSKQVEAVDVLIVSHDDSDHSGGLDAFMESDYKPNSLITTFAVKPSYEKSVLCDSRLNFAWQGDVQVMALWPVNHDMGVGLVHGELQSDNDSSCVVSITYNDNKVLLTGDISKRVEKRLVNSEAVMSGNLDVLSVSHHGSKTSSSELFLKSVNPNYAVISSGPLNRFRHPHESVLNRLRSYSSQVFNTGVDGAVGFIWRDDQSSFDVLLPFNENQPYWKVKRTEQ